MPTRCPPPLRPAPTSSSSATAVSQLPLGGSRRLDSMGPSADSSPAPTHAAALLASRSAKKLQLDYLLSSTSLLPPSLTDTKNKLSIYLGRSACAGKPLAPVKRGFIFFLEVAEVVALLSTNPPQKRAEKKSRKAKSDCVRNRIQNQHHETALHRIRHGSPPQVTWGLQNTVESAQLQLHHRSTKVLPSRFFF